MALQFLSPEWITEAQRTLSTDTENLPADTDVKLNLVIANSPLGKVELKMRVRNQGVELSAGRFILADATTECGYETARAMWLSTDSAVGLNAYSDGALKVSGDLSRLAVLDFVGPFAKESAARSALIAATAAEAQPASPPSTSESVTTTTTSTPLESSTTTTTSTVTPSEQP